MSQQRDDTPTYIGDGVYVSYAEQHIWLTTERYDIEKQETTTHSIALEPEVFEALIKYVERLHDASL